MRDLLSFRKKRKRAKKQVKQRAREVDLNDSERVSMVIELPFKLFEALASEGDVQKAIVSRLLDSIKQVENHPDS